MRGFRGAFKIKVSSRAVQNGPRFFPTTTIGTCTRFSPSKLLVLREQHSAASL